MTDMTPILFDFDTITGASKTATSPTRTLSSLKGFRKLMVERDGKPTMVDNPRSGS